VWRDADLKNPFDTADLEQDRGEIPLDRPRPVNRELNRLSSIRDGANFVIERLEAEVRVGRGCQGGDLEFLLTKGNSAYTHLWIPVFGGNPVV
jgi:hypothetical protein